MFESQATTDARVYAQTIQDCKNFIAIHGSEGSISFVAQHLTIEDIRCIIHHYGVHSFERDWMGVEGEMPFKVATMIVARAL